MKLSNHFTLEELTFSMTAERNGIPNIPSNGVISNLRFLAQNLEEVRSMCNRQPVYINSGYRSPELNKTIGGSPRSDHINGLAADFKIPSFGSPREVAERIAVSGMDFDQLIHEGTWVHLSVDRKAPKRQILQVEFIDGEAIYTPFA